MTLSRHAGWIWAGILALSPMAYMGSLLVERKLPARVGVTAIDEAEAIRIATQFAESQQIDTQGWEVAAGTNTDADLAALFRLGPPPVLEGFAAPSRIRVRMQTAKQDRSLLVELTPQGVVVAFQKDRPKQQPPADQASARAAAEAFKRVRMGSNSPFQWEYTAPAKPDAEDQDRSFTWKAPVPGLPRATATYRVETRGDQIVAEHRTVTLDKAWVAQLRPNQSWFSAIKGIAGLYMFVVGVYAIVRYIRRAGDKEVSHQRTMLAALAWVSLSALLLLDPGYLTFLVGGDPELGKDRILITIVMMVGMCVIGAFFGVAYGAGEGGLRESYAGKLTSLDALLSGKLFSANVARSILRGGGIAGWLLLTQNLVLLALHSVRAGADQNILASSFMRLPLMALSWDRASDAVVQTTFGLLLPIALLRRRMRDRSFYALLALFSILSAAVTAGDETSWATFFTVQLSLVAAVYLPFFSSDLLAAIGGVFALRFVGALIQRSAVSATWEHIFLWNVAPAGIAFLLAEVYFAWRGRVYDEDEVRPRYARFLAEHASMDAEIGAARLAQLRLLPGAPPNIEGLSIAGSCVPAREVGGDFFDFYELGSGRLGVFVAEGGSRHLGSAMTIALAKGYLLYTAGLDLSPAEIVRRLSETLGAALHNDASMSVLYAVVDARARTVRFARTGVSPRLLINGNPVTEELAGDTANAKGIRHGLAALALHDVVFFYTDGLAAQIAERKRQWTDRFLQKLVSTRPDWPAAELHDALVKAAVRGKQHPPDDVTSVVVRVEQPAVRAMEVVA
jgi:hypothetical protein